MLRTMRSLTGTLRAMRVLGGDEELVAERLAGGFHNDVYLARTRSGAVVVKHYIAASPNPLFPQLPDHEHRALCRLSGTGLAPEAVSFQEADASGRAVLVYRYIAGSMWTDDVAAVGSMLTRLHQLGIVDGFRELPASPADVQSQARRIVQGIEVPVRLAAHLEHGESDTRPVVTLVHTDCGPGNIIVSENGPCLIDWQCPGIGDPVEDLANFASPAIQILYERAPLTASAVDELLDAYAEPDVVARFRRDRWAFHTRLAAYCVFRAVELADRDADTAALYGRALAAELDLLESRP
jgi:thiamine kinase